MDSGRSTAGGVMSRAGENVVIESKSWCPRPWRLGLHVFMAAALVAAFDLITPQTAHAVSPGCSAANAGSLDLAGLGGAQTQPQFDFDDGDQINVSVFAIAAVNFTMGSQVGLTDIANNVAIAASLTEVFSFPIIDSVSIELDVNVGGGTANITVTCIAGGATEAIQQSTANAAAATAISQTGGLVAGRIRGLGGAPRGGGGAGVSAPQQTAAFDAQGLVDLSAGRTGMSAGVGESPWGVWANFSWTGIQDTTAVAGTDGNAIMGIAGADYAVSDGFIVGGAFTLGGASFDSTVSAFDTDEVGIGLVPYLAYQFTDLLSLEAVAGYSFGVGESTRNETITGHYGIHRYFVASNLSFFKAWDRFSFLASGGVTWGQSFENAYSESDGTQVGSRRSDIGSVSILAQPAYLFEVDTGTSQPLFLEPYLLGQYSYDFVISKIAGHNNDRDAFRVGAGLNIFSGNSVSGNLEFGTDLGREDRDIYSVSGTVRYQF
ncbi:MAG: autotransporter outer membrane beta-barrel domain-containing protein [Pseudomonadota bacterium]